MADQLNAKTTTLAKIVSYLYCPLAFFFFPLPHISASRDQEVHSDCWSAPLCSSFIRTNPAAFVSITTSDTSLESKFNI